MPAKLSNWSTAAVQKLWDQGRILAARLHADALLPLEIPLRTRDVNHRQALFAALRDDVHGPHVRLEQERIGYGWVMDVLDK